MYDPKVHHRRSIRLRGYDYSQAGAYAVTICTEQKQGLFGEIVEGEMVLNDVGRMVQQTWNEIPSHYAGCGLDAFVVMPNHVHGIILITAPPETIRPDPSTPAAVGAGPPRACPGRPLSLPDVVQRFKSLTTARHRQGVALQQWPDLGGMLWQRNYYEHIVRNDDELQKIREYIVTNPLRWETDWENILGSGRT
jgi:REP element-mobilizing transposase RayT